MRPLPLLPEELYTSCTTGHPYGAGQAFWGSGGLPQGGQSEYVRVPMAQTTLEIVPERLCDPGHDNALLLMTDNLPTGYHAAVGAEISPGSIVLVIGDGAVGLLAAHAATLFGPALVVMVGHHDDRLAVGERLGVTVTVNSTATDPAPIVQDLTAGLGPHAVIDSVGSASSLRFAAENVRAGGTVSWVGMNVFFDPPQLPWDLAFFRNIRFHGGAAPVRRYLRHLWPLLEQGRIDPTPVLTHDLPLEEAAGGYDVMAHRKDAVKVALSP